MRCDAKRSLSLNFFLIDFSRANLGMHWQQARPEAPMPRCSDAHVHRQEDRLPCGSCSFVSSPLFRNCLSAEIYVHFPLFSFQFSSLHFVFFVISFENVRLVIQQIPSSVFSSLSSSFSCCSTPTYMHPICRVPCHSTRH